MVTHTHANDRHVHHARQDCGIPEHVLGSGCRRLLLHFCSGYFVLQDCGHKQPSGRIPLAVRGTCSAERSLLSYMYPHGVSQHLQLCTSRRRRLWRLVSRQSLHCSRCRDRVPIYHPGRRPDVPISNYAQCWGGLFILFSRRITLHVLWHGNRPGPGRARQVLKFFHRQRSLIRGWIAGLY